MAPGAVMVMGKTTKEQFGKIALAGPLSNVIMWGLGIGLIVLGLETTEFTSLIGGKERGLLYLWCWGNAGLGAFNMIPFGPLDGRKVKTWSNVASQIQEIPSENGVPPIAHHISAADLPMAKFGSIAYTSGWV